LQVPLEELLLELDELLLDELELLELLDEDPEPSLIVPP
jgi:hypothetical protein